MSNDQHNKKDYIGVTKLKGHTLNFYYIGGSRIGIEYDTGQKGTTTKQVFEAMVHKNQVKITDVKRWAEICAQIRPDGSTKTHNADGSAKTAMQQTLGDLIDENIVARNDDGSLRISSDDDKPKAVKAPDGAKKKAEAILNSSTPVPSGAMDASRQVAGAGVRPSGKSQVGGGRRNPRAAANDEHVESNELDENRNDDFDGHGARKQPVADARNRRQARLANDLNGDGEIDEFDNLIEQEQRKNGFVMVVFFGAIFISVLLFFFVHSATAAILHGETFSFLPSGGETPIEQADNRDENDNNNTETPDSDESGDGQIETVTRTDFDPESAVINYPVVDGDDYRMATTLMKMIREDINNGDVKSFNEAVDIEAIAGQIAPEYAYTAKDLQNLTDSQAQDLMFYYHQTFRDNERTHVINKDPYGSIFGGRVREVRRDPHDMNKLYIVMEAISGDHQRICFVMQGDGQNNWVINGITDPSGYVRMIQKGVIE